MTDSTSIDITEGIIQARGTLLLNTCSSPLDQYFALHCAQVEIKASLTVLVQDFSSTQHVNESCSDTSVPSQLISASILY